jgi:hypothetical protein
MDRPIKEMTLIASNWWCRFDGNAGSIGKFQGTPRLRLRPVKAKV